MNWIVVQGVKPWDGRYEFDIVDNELTTREWGWVKRLTGYLPLTVEQGLEGGDPELFACFAALMIRRAGKIGNGEVQEVFDRIADSPFGSTIQLETDDQNQEGADADSPPASSNGSEHSSGTVSTLSSETSEPIPLASGTPDWVISQSGPLTSES